MSVIEQTINIIQQGGALPLYYADDEQTSVEVLKALYSAGCRAIEYTNRGANAYRNFKAMQAACKEELRDMLLGIGTIKSVEDAKLFSSAGAHFMVSPGVVPGVADIAKEAGILWIPGGMTATEIILAEQQGAKLVKLFPGSLLGASYVSAIRDIFPDLLFMPTGGVEVTEDNLGGWFKAGVCAVGLGSKVITKEALQQQDYSTIETNTKEALEMIKKVRNVIGE